MSPLCKNCGQYKTCRANILICSSFENRFEDNFRDVSHIAGQRQQFSETSTCKQY